MGRLTLWQSFGCIRLALWDEAQRKLISFRELRAAAPATQPQLSSNAPP